MAISINNGYSSSFTTSQLQQGSRTLNETPESISSGNRINNSADDAAGMTIADGALQDGSFTNQNFQTD